MFLFFFLFSVAVEETIITEDVRRRLTTAEVEDRDRIRTVLDVSECQTCLTSERVVFFVFSCLSEDFSNSCLFFFIFLVSLF